MFAKVLINNIAKQFNAYRFSARIYKGNKTIKNHAKQERNECEAICANSIYNTIMKWLEQKSQIKIKLIFEIFLYIYPEGEM